MNEEKTFTQTSGDNCTLYQSEHLNINIDLEELAKIISSKSLSEDRFNNVIEILNYIKLDFDKGNYSLGLLEKIKSMIVSSKNEKLLLEYDLLEARYLVTIEKPNEAKIKYNSISKRHPQDLRAFLCLANIFINNGDLKKNKEFILKAKSIDESHSLLKVETLIRSIFLKENIDLEKIDEILTVNNLSIQVKLYRLYSLYFNQIKDFTNAEKYIEKAIYLDENILSNHIVKLQILTNKFFSTLTNEERLIKSDFFLKKIESIENKFSGSISNRNKMILNLNKTNFLLIQGNYSESIRLSAENLDLCITCYFDKQNEQIISEAFSDTTIPKDKFKKILDFIQSFGKILSDQILKELIYQFCVRQELFTVGKSFFENLLNKLPLDLIEGIENNNYKKVLDILKDDHNFAFILASVLEEYPELKSMIINQILKDEEVSEMNLVALFEDDRAFTVLQNNDINSLNVFTACKILPLVHKKEAWDFKIILLQKILEAEKDENSIFNYKLQLFNALLYLNKYSELLVLGEELLKSPLLTTLLDFKNREKLLANTIISCFNYGKLNKEYIIKSKEILELHLSDEPSFLFRTNVEFEVYLKNLDQEKAFKAIIKGIEEKKTLSPQEYAQLYLKLIMEIVPILNLNLNSLDKVDENTFVKLKDINQWYFIGDKNELDAILIDNTNSKYPFFINKNFKEKIIIKNSYGDGNKEEIIEFIFPVEKYIYWNITYHFQNLSKNNDLAYVKMLKVGNNDDENPFSQLFKVLKDDHDSKEPLFNMYCEENIPLSLLALNEGGLIKAISRIQNENRGFIKFSNGTVEEFECQKNIARKIIETKLPFYIDATSALFLIEKGLFKKIYEFVPNIKIPQSVMNFLINTIDVFENTSGKESGYIGYFQQKLRYSTIETDKKDTIKTSLIESIQLLKSSQKNIVAISSANKLDCSSEQKVAPELSDACILAQKENIPILTEDYLYLQWNELETKKEVPSYFSSLALLIILNEKELVSYKEYLDFFAYLSCYRFKFLHITSNDIWKAVFNGEKKANSENIKKLNFQLTLSEEYGVPFLTSFQVVGQFLLKVLADDEISLNDTENIFIEIVNNFPNKESKKDFSNQLLRICFRVVQHERAKNTTSLNYKIVDEKISQLLQVISSDIEGCDITALD